MKKRSLMILAVMAWPALAYGQAWVVFHGARPSQAVRTQLRASDEIKTDANSQADVIFDEALLLRLGREGDLVVTKLSDSSAELELRQGKLLVQRSTPTAPVTAATVDLAGAQVSWPGSSDVILALHSRRHGPGLIAVGAGTVIVANVRGSSSTLTVPAGNKLDVQKRRAMKNIVPLAAEEQSDLLRWAGETPVASTLQADLALPVRTLKPEASESTRQESPDEKSPPEESHDAPGTRGEAFPRNAENLRP